VFRAWLWFDYKAAAVRWVPIAIGLLRVGTYLRYGSDKPRVKGWVTRKLLTFALSPGWAPSCLGGFPRGAVRTIPVDDWEISGRAARFCLERGLVVTVLLCTRRSRDYLLGHGKALSCRLTVVAVLTMIVGVGRHL